MQTGATVFTSLFALTIFTASTMPVLAQQATAGIRRAADRQSVVNFTELAQRRILAPASAATVFTEKPRPRSPLSRQLATATPAKSPSATALIAATAATQPSLPPAASFPRLFRKNSTIPPAHT